MRLNNIFGDNMAINLMRIGFFALIVFEFLNVVNIITLNTQYTWRGLLLTAVFSLVVLEWTNIQYVQKKGRPLPWVIWLVIETALAVDAFGDFFFLYARFPWWDQLVHFSVSAILAYILFIVIDAFWIDHFKFALLLKSGKTRLALLLSATTAISFGALYEVEEYVEDLLFFTHRSGGGVDTANDLSMNLLGVIFSVSLMVAYHWFVKWRKN